MGDLRKDRTKKQGLLSKSYGRSDGLKASGRVPTRDTGRAAGGITRRTQSPKKMGPRF
jgi:hypothetical protein